MRVKIGCMSRPWMNYPLERALEGIAKAGFSYTAYVGNHEKKPSYTLDSTSKELADLRKKTESFGLTAVAAWGSDPLRYGSEGLRRHIDIAEELGLKYLIISSPYYKERKQPEIPIDEEFIQYVEAALPRAESANIEIHVKPHSGPFGDGPGLASLVQRVNHHLFRVSYDPGNIHSYEGLQAEEDVESVSSLVNSMCVKDFSKKRRKEGVKRYISPGEGDVHWKSVWGSLASSKFNGFALVELLGGDTADILDAEASKTYDTLTRWIHDAGGKVVG